MSIILILKPDSVKLLNCAGWAGVELIVFFFPVAGMGIVWDLSRDSVDNTGMFSLLLSSVYTASRPFLHLTPPTSEWAEGARGVGRGDTGRTADPK